MHCIIMSDARTAKPCLNDISDVDYNTNLKSPLKPFWFFSSYLLLIFSSLDILVQENIIGGFLAIFLGFTCH